MKSEILYNFVLSHNKTPLPADSGAITATCVHEGELLVGIL